MAETARVTCPGCKTAYPWSEKFAGRKVLCRCGIKMRFPDQPNGSIQVLDYGNGMGVPTTQSRVRWPSSNPELAALNPEAVAATEAARRGVAIRVPSKRKLPEPPKTQEPGPLADDQTMNLNLDDLKIKE